MRAGGPRLYVGGCAQEQQGLEGTDGQGALCSALATMQAQQHLSPLLYTSWKPPPTPSPTRPQLRAPQATRKRMARSCPEAPEPQVSSACTLGLRGRSFTSRKQDTMTNNGSLRTGDHGNMFSPVPPTQSTALWQPLAQQQELAHASSLHSLPSTQGDLSSVTAQLPSITFHSHQTRLLTGPGSLSSSYTSPRPRTL